MNFADTLTNVYKDQDADFLLAKIKKKLGPLNSSSKSYDWYKHAILYVTYPDAFEIDGRKDFYTLTSLLDSIAELGCNAVHVLPFLQSPMIDAGFDISSFTTVRPELGGEAGFSHFLSQAKKKGIRVFMDLVLNHTSNQHVWYQNAVSGDKKYRDFYTHCAKKPKLLGQETDNLGVWAIYNLEGREVRIREIFPEQAGELPHWTQGGDGYWYYHTFYPNQIDLNWNNPNVFLAFIDIIQKWASMGLHFRLDAVPYIGKDIFSGVIESSQQTHSIVQLLNQIAKQINSECALLVEAFQPETITMQYFGNNDQKQIFELHYQLTQFQTSPYRSL